MYNQKTAIGPSATHDIAKPCSAYLRMCEAWKLIRDLNGGTRAMRAAGEMWLPKEEAETDSNYTSRLNRSVLYEGYRDAIDTLLSKPFSQRITLSSKLPEELADIEEDVDLMGTSLTEWSAMWLRDALNYGISHALVDYPSVGGDQKYGVEVESRIRPYFVQLSAVDVIGWTEEDGPNGRKRLTSVRWKEIVSEKTDFGMDEVEQVRRMTFVYKDQITPDSEDSKSSALGVVETWREAKSDSGSTWEVVESHNHTFVGLPLVSLRLNATSSMEAAPVLEKLAWLNLAHWQSDSDQRNNLRFARVGILLATGLNSDEIKGKFKVGPNSIVKLTSENANVRYVTGGTEGLVAGRQDAIDIESRMEVFGLAPTLSRRPSEQPATTAAIDSKNESCDLQTWARLEEHALALCFTIAAEWAKVTLPNDLTVDIFTEFETPFSQTQDVAILNQIQMAGNITRRTLLEELKRRGFLSDVVDVDDELNSIASEGPALSDATDDDPLGLDQTDSNNNTTPPDTVAFTT